MRELLAEARSAAQAAMLAEVARVEAPHLSPSAGSAFARPEASLEPEGPKEPPPAQVSQPPTRARLVGVLKRVEGNTSAAARELGVHRTQLRRWLERYGLDPRAYMPVGRGAVHEDEDK